MYENTILSVITTLLDFFRLEMLSSPCSRLSYWVMVSLECSVSISQEHVTRNSHLHITSHRVIPRIPDDDALSSELDLRQLVRCLAPFKGRVVARKTVIIFTSSCKCVIIYFIDIQAEILLDRCWRRVSVHTSFKSGTY